MRFFSRIYSPMLNAVLGKGGIKKGYQKWAKLD
jgi:hypothetical protein